MVERVRRQPVLDRQVRAPEDARAVAEVRQLPARRRGAAVRGLLDECWYVVQDEDTRLQLLIDRHIAFGKAPDFAREWVLRSDQRNAELVAATQPRADALIRIG